MNSRLTFIFVTLILAFALPSAFHSFATGISRESASASKPYPLGIWQFAGQNCPGYTCTMVQIVNNSTKNMAGILFGNASGDGVSGRIVYTANTSISVPAGQAIWDHLAFSGVEPGFCELRFAFVVLATNGSQLSNSISFGPGSCILSGTVSASLLDAHCSKLGALNMASITYRNNLNSDLFPIVYGVMHNSIGQTVYYTTATLAMAINGTATGYLAIVGLEHGNYSITAFMITPSGIVISPTTTLNCSV